MGCGTYGLKWPWRGQTSEDAKEEIKKTFPKKGSQILDKGAFLLFKAFWGILGFKAFDSINRGSLGFKPGFLTSVSYAMEMHLWLLTHEKEHLSAGTGNDCCYTSIPRSASSQGPSGVSQGDAAEWGPGSPALMSPCTSTSLHRWGGPAGHTAIQAAAAGPLRTRLVCSSCTNSELWSKIQITLPCCFKPDLSQMTQTSWNTTS